jgi:hypothetical protein
MLAQRPEDRFASYQELSDAIDRAFSSSGPSSAHSPTGSSPTSKVRLWLAIAGVVLAVVMTVAAVSWWRLSSRETPVPMVPGKSVNLFSGKNLAGWFPEHGNWQPSQDDEGGTVLAGTGAIRRPIPKMANYRLLMGMDLRNARAVEIHFGLTGADRPRYVVRIQPGEAVLGEQTGARGELRPLASKSVPRDGAGLATPYKEVRIDRAAGRWHAYYHNQWIGAAPARDNELPEFRLTCEAGPAYFETIEVIELLPVK